MSSNNAFFGFEEDDEPIVKNKQSNGVSKKKKKKKKKSSNKSKSNSVDFGKDKSALEQNPLEVMKNRLLAAGYSKGQVNQAVDAMFQDGESYDDYEEVKKRLDGKSVTKKNDSAGNAKPTRHEQVRKGAAKSKAQQSAKVEAEPQADGWQAVGSKAKTVEAAAPQDPAVGDEKKELWARLEKATKMRPIATVMEVLIRWCKQNPDDLAELFACKAMNQLLGNYLTDRYTAAPGQNRKDVDIMNELLSCVFKAKIGGTILKTLTSFTATLRDLQLENDGWRRAISSYASFLSKRLGEYMQFGDKIESVPSDLKKLQQHLQANINGSDEFGKEMDAAKASSAEKTANLFRRRDFASERVVLGDMIRKNTQRLVDACGGSSGGPSSGGSLNASSLGDDNAVYEMLGMSKDDIANNSKKSAEAKEVEKQLKSLRKEQENDLKPVLSEEKTVEEKISSLEKKKEELMLALKSVTAELEVSYGERSSIVARKAEVSVRAKEKLDKLDADHKGMAVHIRRAEGQKKIAGDLRHFDQELMNHSRGGSEGARRTHERLKKALQAAGGSSATQKASTEVLRSALAYATYELPCLTLMRGRVKENSEKITKNGAEITSMKSLGLANVVADLERSARQCATFIEQDKGVINALTAKSLEVFEIVKSTGESRRDDIDGLTSKLLADLKKAFIALNVGVGEDWTPPKAAGADESSSMFSSNLAAGLGIAPKAAAPAKPQAPAANGTTKKSSTSKKPKKESAAPKMGWGKPAPAKKGGKRKSMLQLQAEELESRLTEENLKRLETGRAPARSPLLERLQAELENEEDA